MAVARQLYRRSNPAVGDCFGIHPPRNDDSRCWVGWYPTQRFYRVCFLNQPDKQSDHRCISSFLRYGAVGANCIRPAVGLQTDIQIILIVSLQPQGVCNTPLRC